MSFKRSFFAFVLLVLAALGFVFFKPKTDRVVVTEPLPPVAEEQSKPKVIEALPPLSYEETLPPRFQQSPDFVRNDPTELISSVEEVQRLNDLSISEQTAMNDLHTLIQSCGGIANQGDMPTGLNCEITDALLGKNYLRIAYLPASLKRINEYGELVDRWGTAYDFHCVSTKRMDISSAGPDQIWETEDDIFLERR